VAQARLWSLEVEVELARECYQTLGLRDSVSQCQVLVAYYQQISRACLYCLPLPVYRVQVSIYPSVNHGITHRGIITSIVCSAATIEKSLSAIPRGRYDGVKICPSISVELYLA